MRTNKTPRSPRASCATSVSINSGSDFSSTASIRNQYGRGIQAYERAKADWHAGNPGADFRAIERAMRRIAEAVGI